MVPEKSESFYKSLLDNLHDAIYFVDIHRKITYWNRSAERISGFRAEEVIGYSCSDNILMHVDDTGLQLCLDRCPLVKAMEDGNTHEANVFMHHKDGHRVPVRVHISPIRDDEGNIIGGVELFYDRSNVIAELEKITEMEKELYIDPLTGIGNRRYTQEKLESSMLEYMRTKVAFGVLFADLDHFKAVNDHYGHNTGDMVLEMVSATLALNLRVYDYVGRWGGDEFIIIVSNADMNRFFRMAERMRLLVAQSSLSMPEGPLSVTISIGGAMAREGDDVSTLIERADRQLYLSKDGGRNRVTMIE